MKLEINDNKIVNYQEIIDYILNSKNLDDLEYLSFQLDNINQTEEVIKLKEMVNNRFLLANSIASLDVVNTLKKLINTNSLDAGEYKNITNYVEELLQSFKNETISLDNQNYLDTFIDYLRSSDKNDLNPKWINILNEYEEIINIKTHNKLKLAKDKVLELKPVTSNKSGIIRTISVIDITVLLGLFLGILALALKLK